MNEHLVDRRPFLVPLDMRDIRIGRTSLRNANLTEADLSRANCTGVDFRGANFDRAKLDKTNLKGADLTGAHNLTREQIATAILDETTILPDYLR